MSHTFPLLRVGEEYIGGVPLYVAETNVHCATVFRGSAITSSHRLAHVLAAAPDLLAALQAFVDDYTLICGDGLTADTEPDLLRTAKAALAKAEGR